MKKLCIKRDPVIH